LSRSDIRQTCSAVWKTATSRRESGAYPIIRQTENIRQENMHLSLFAASAAIKQILGRNLLRQSAAKAANDLLKSTMEPER
jgi:hypothetical protein